MEEKTKQKQSESRQGDKMKMVWNVGSVNGENRSCGELKNF